MEKVEEIKKDTMTGLMKIKKKSNKKKKKLTI